MYLDLLKSLGVALILAYLGLALFAWLFAYRLIFPVPQTSYTENSNLIHLSTPSNTSITALYLPNPQARAIIFFHHGNGEDLGHIYNRLLTYQKNGYAVFAYDYPGYGLSGGKPSEATVFEASDLVAEYLHTELKWARCDTILYGRSLGGGPATRLATQYAFGGLILEASFTSTFRVLTKHSFLPWDYFNNLSRIGNIKSPLLVIHGTEDKTVPFIHAQQLLNAAPLHNRFLWIDGAGHNDIPESTPLIYWDTVNEFIRTIQKQKPAL